MMSKIKKSWVIT